MSDEIDLHVGRWFRDFADLGIFTTDRALNISSWNRWLERHTGCVAATVLGKRLVDLYPELDSRGVMEYYSDALKGGVSLLSHGLHGHLLPIAVRHEQSTAHLMPQRAHISPLIVDATVVGTITVVQDVTERVATESALRAQREVLEQTVEQRTRALATEVREHREAEERAKDLARRLVTLQEEERRRVARDLHDQVGQHMTALHLKLEMLRRMGPSDDGWKAACVDVQQYFQQFDRELDVFTSELRLGSVHTLGLVPALTDHVARWSKLFGIPCELEAIGLTGISLGTNVETTLFRIAQEALTNVVKHAQASAVSVVIQRRDGRIILAVEDDGAGFEDSATSLKAKGFGLAGIAERAELLGGTAHVESTCGRGTTVMVSIPVARLSGLAIRGHGQE